MNLFVEQTFKLLNSIHKHNIEIVRNNHRYFKIKFKSIILLNFTKSFPYIFNN